MVQFAQPLDIDSCVVHEHVETPVFGPHQLCERVDLGLIGDIEKDGTNVACDGRGSRGPRVPIARSEEDGDASSCQPTDDSETDALVASGDQGDFGR